MPEEQFTRSKIALYTLKYRGLTAAILLWCNMELAYFLNAYIKIAPLYLFVIIGFIAGRLKADRKSIANILIFLITPIVFFNIGFHTHAEIHHIFLPVVAFLLSSFLCIIYLKLSKRILDEKMANLMAFAAGASNSGYFGLPIMLAFFSDELAGIYMLTAMGVAFYEYTVGAYVMERGTHSVKQSIKKVAKLPMMHAFVLGIILNNIGFTMPDTMDKFFHYTQGCYVVLGLMLIGIGLAGLTHFKIKWKFVWILLSARFILSPIIALILICIDLAYLHIYSIEINYTILVLSIMPPAVNTVVFATVYNTNYEEAAVSVLIGVIIAALFIPFLFYYMA